MSADTGTIGLTGASGDLVQRVLSRITDIPAPLVLLVRNVDKMRASIPEANKHQIRDVRPCDFNDKAICTESLKGIDTLLFVSAMEAQDRLSQHINLVEAATEAGVKHIVYTSFHNAKPDAVFHHARDHYHTEEKIKSTGMEYTFLRNSYYQDILPHFVTDGAIRGPAGNGVLAPVTKDNLADCIAVILRDPSVHTGRTYSLTGPEELTFAQIAEVMGVKYVDETDEEAQASRKGSAEPWLVDAWISTYTAVRDGEEAGKTDDVETLTGKKPTNFQDWFQDYSKR